ncbi:MAG: NAD(P)-binding domain-containing protein, partial [Verrucomicrobiota bacterium]|nr:NAD(P)-binding domain-containing protein [Verrucomicrobiota bacterium]
MRTKFCAPNEIIAAEPVLALREKLAAATGIYLTTENAEVAEKADIILLGVKPAVVLAVIKEIASQIGDKVVVSLAAGIRLESMEPLADARFMRAMTNTPAAIGRAATALASGSRTTREDLAKATEIFVSIGAVVEIDEEQIDAVTALAGSRPAFVYSV